MDAEGLLQCTLFDEKEFAGQHPLQCCIAPKHIVYVSEFRDKTRGAPNHTTIHLEYGEEIKIEESIDQVMNCLHKIYG